DRRRAALPADPPGRPDRRPQLRDHLPQCGRPGLRIHLRLIREGATARSGGQPLGRLPVVRRPTGGAPTFRRHGRRSYVSTRAAAAAHDRGPERRAHATWFELLFDLVFAAAVIELATGLAKDPSGAVFARFDGLFAAIADSQSPDSGRVGAHGRQLTGPRPRTRLWFRRLWRRTGPNSGRTTPTSAT